MMMNDLKQNELNEAEMHEVTGGFIEPALTEEELLRKLQAFWETGPAAEEDQLYTEITFGSW